MELWTKGYGQAADGEALLERLHRFGAATGAEQFGEFLSGLDGHFAIVACGPGWTLGAVDYVRSIPLAFAKCGGRWCIDDQAARLHERVPGDINRDAALALAMSGYTIDVATLYRDVQQLGPGELALFSDGGEPRRHRYYTYRPWRADKPAYDSAIAQKRLAEITLALIDKTMKSVGDRILAVPLSAGRDSRLIVSAARHLGYRNVRTFAYGHPGNHEAVASQAIAERLGFPWKFVATGTASMRRYFSDGTHGSYCRFADTLQSAPFVQDFLPIATLKADGFLPRDAVICNGNSGDYISGAHVVHEMRTPQAGLSQDERLATITRALFNKHFGLWDALKTPANQSRIKRQLRDSIARAGVTLGDPADDYGIYEYAEFQDRQCKFVISGQRICEFLGFEWRLPLWEKTYIDFFEKIPLAGKTGQRLYADMLTATNWGGVWRDMPVNAKTVRPNWIRPLRFMAKLAHGPFGRKAWHRFERRYFYYWMDGGGRSAIRPYGVTARDRRGARHAIAWLTEDYLRGHGIDYDGVLLAIGGAA